MPNYNRQVAWMGVLCIAILFFFRFVGDIFAVQKFIAQMFINAAYLLLFAALLELAVLKLYRQAHMEVAFSRVLPVMVGITALLSAVAALFYCFKSSGLISIGQGVFCATAAAALLVTGLREKGWADKFPRQAEAILFFLSSLGMLLTGHAMLGVETIKLPFLAAAEGVSLGSALLVAMPYIINAVLLILLDVALIVRGVLLLKKQKET